jgi:hypothetical protein
MSWPLALLSTVLFKVNLLGAGTVKVNPVSKSHVDRAGEPRP